MNTIEMQSITALAHLRACIMYFMDLSEQCGYSVADQVKLFQSIRPLFSGKPTFIVINKIDVCRPSDLPQETQDLLNSLTTDPEFPIQILQLSCHSTEGVMDVRNAACEALLTQRVESKEKSKRAEALLGRLRVAVPTARDEVARLPHIPDEVQTRKKYDKDDPDRIKLEKDLENEGAGAGAYSVDMMKYYMLGNEDWKYDNIPEVKDGKNIRKSWSRTVTMTTMKKIWTTPKKAQIRLLNQSKDKKQNRAIIPRTKQTRTLDEMTSKLREAGYDPSNLEERAKLIAKAKGLVDGEGKKRKRNDEDGEDGMDVDQEGDGDDGWGSTDEESEKGMDVDGESKRSAKRQKGNKGTVVHKGKRVPGKNRAVAGMSTDAQIARSNRLKFVSQRKPNRLAKAGEADRHVATKMPKHLYTGKRKMGKTNRR
ncbi:NOG1-domain-containing protein [Atractiella rhizophila]|nr:NOG1-domain-containing protein [Atractiella rhizophila]